jgi:hypothetical protein
MASRLARRVRQLEQWRDKAIDMALAALTDSELVAFAAYHARAEGRDDQWPEGEAEIHAVDRYIELVNRFYDEVSHGKH